MTADVSACCNSIPRATLNEHDYIAAAKRSQGRGTALSGAEIVAIWEPSLSSKMTEYGIGISEEAVVAPLLSDLTRD
ncbi:DUF2399 domain-containing protein [Burkholderia ambifaria]|uniref:DUF2399 domain-containing protein n=1 Tax=Burkholderia ambifaria TaxID=152480 RepID=UPI001FC8B7DD|nr:DUF2399 domain-containing protein [Burkholderia ambifaria]